MKTWEERMDEKMKELKEFMNLEEKRYSKHWKPKYDIRTNKGITEVWLDYGNMYIKLPGLITADIHQDPDFAKFGIAEVQITVHVNLIKTIDK